MRGLGVFGGGTRRRLTVGATAAAIAAGGLISGSGVHALSASAASTSASPSAPGFAVSQAIDPSTGTIYVAAQGPSHSLYFYWDIAGTWNGPVAVAGAGTTYSAPSVAIDNAGHVDIAVQGPGHSVDFYWNVNGTWYGPLQVAGAGTAASGPSLVSDFDHNLDLAVQTPAKNLLVFWNTAAAWYGPYGLGAAGTAMSRPSATASSDSNGHHLLVSVEGANHALLVYTSTNGSWSSLQSAAGTTYAAPSLGVRGSGSPRIYVEGPGNDLDQWTWYSSSSTTNHMYGYYPVGPGGVTVGSPSGAGDSYVVAPGPGSTLYFYWFAGGSGFEGPLAIGPAGAAQSVPSMAVPASNQGPSIAVEGPNHALYFYWNVSGTWYGPLGIGAAGTTFASPS